MTGEVSKKKIVSVSLLLALISLLDFLTREDGTDRLSRNVSKDLPLYSV